MGSLFSYFEGSLLDFLTHVKEMQDNSLVKIKLSVGNFQSYTHVIDNFAVKHIIAKHANDKEIKRGQIIIEESDFLLIPEIISNYDSRTIRTSEKGSTVIVYTKTYRGCEYTYIEVFRKERHELAGVTFYKRKRKLTGAKS